MPLRGVTGARCTRRPSRGARLSSNVQLLHNFCRHVRGGIGRDAAVKRTFCARGIKSPALGTAEVELDTMDSNSRLVSLGIGRNSGEFPIS